MKNYLFILFSFFSISLFSQIDIELENFAGAVPHNPLGLVNCGDDRLFAVCKDGYVMIFDTAGVMNPVPFLNISGRVESIYQSHGLLGMAFHPDYAGNGYFYVNYINNDENSVIARFSVSAGDPDVADTTSEQILLVVDQPFRVHKGGDMHFGPDGYLYFPFGDGGFVVGGGPGDPDNRAQNPETYLGKMLRIDVDAATPYAIPVSNPFYGATDTLNEIWAIGLRNPWRFSFDDLTGDMWIADVGQDLWEEIDFEPAGFTGGNNYGWRCYEGNAEYNFDSCDATTDYTFPIHVYAHDDSTGGYSVTGGYVYRGTNYPGFYGKYFYCDYINSNFYTLEPDGAGGWINHIYPGLMYGVVSFGEDKNGELYVVSLEDASIWKLKDNCATFTASGIVANENCGIFNDGEIDLTVDGGTSPYDFAWSNGDSIEDISGLHAGNYIVTITDSAGCIFIDSFEVVLDGIIEVTINATGNILNATGGTFVTWQWYLNGDPISGATASTYEAVEDGLYSVEVTDANGCSDLSDELFVDVASITAYYLVNLLISPNPANDEIYLQWKGNHENARYEIIAIDGKTVLSGKLKKNVINIRSIPPGTYSLHVFTDSVRGENVFVKQ